MPKHLPPEHTRFKKGQSGNPGGRPKLPEHLKSVLEISADELKRTIAMHFRMSEDEIDLVLKNRKSPSLNLIIAAAIKKAIDSGDLQRAEYLFMRSLGKVKDVMEVTQPEPVVIQRANGETIEIGVKEKE